MRKIEAKDNKIAILIELTIYLSISIKELKVILLKFKAFSITPSKLIIIIITIARLLSKKISA